MTLMKNKEQIQMAAKRRKKMVLQCALGFVDSPQRLAFHSCRSDGSGHRRAVTKGGDREYCSQRTSQLEQRLR
jgi:hypothetical protein